MIKQPEEWMDVRTACLSCFFVPVQEPTIMKQAAVAEPSQEADNLEQMGIVIK